MHILSCTTVSDAWVKTFEYLDKNGVKSSGLKEELNLAIEITDFKHDKTFDRYFRSIFGDERIDYASSYSFIDPRTEGGYRQNQEGKWTKTYWGRLHNWNGTFNQIEQVLKRLKQKNSAKTIVAQVMDPISDGKKVMGGLPCLLSVDFKPRPEGLHITCYFRSMRYSKSGYGDFDAFTRMGLFLCEEAGLKLAKVTFIAGSGHISSSGIEYDNSKALIAKLAAKADSRRRSKSR